jgi:hypothetical protein
VNATSDCKTFMTLLASDDHTAHGMVDQVTEHCHPAKSFSLSPAPPIHFSSLKSLFFNTNFLFTPQLHTLHRPRLSHITSSLHTQLPPLLSPYKPFPPLSYQLSSPTHLSISQPTTYSTPHARTLTHTVSTLQLTSNHATTQQLNIDMSGFLRSMGGIGGGMCPGDMGLMGGDDFFGGMGGGMGPMGGGGGGGMVGGGDGRSIQGGFSSFSTFDSARPEGQQYQIFTQPYGDYDNSLGYGGGYQQPQRQGGPMYAAEEPPRNMMTEAIAARRDRRRQNPFLGQRAGGYAPSEYAEQPSYQHVHFDNRDGGQAEDRFMNEYQRTGRVNPQYASQYEEVPRGDGSRGQQPQEEFYDDEEYGDDGGFYDERGQVYEPRQAYAPQQGYGGGGRGRGGRGGERPGPFQGGIWDGPNPFRYR